MSETLSNYPANRPQDSVTGTHPVRTNLIRPLSLPKQAHHYLVTFTPEAKRNSVPRLFSRYIQRDIDERHDHSLLHNTPYAFDGINMLVTSKPIHQSDTAPTVKLVFDNRGIENVMEVTYKNTYTFDEMMKLVPGSVVPFSNYSTHVQVLEVIMRHYQTTKYFTYGKAAYNDTDMFKLTKSIVVWTGVSQTLKMSRMGLLNNLDISFVTFFENVNVIEFFKSLLMKGSGGGPRREGGNRGGPQRRDNTPRREGGYERRDGPPRREGGYERRGDDSSRGGRDQGNERRYERRGGDSESVDIHNSNQRSSSFIKDGNSKDSVIIKDNKHSRDDNSNASLIIQDNKHSRDDNSKDSDYKADNYKDDKYDNSKDSVIIKDNKHSRDDNSKDSDYKADNYKYDNYEDGGYLTNEERFELKGGYSHDRSNYENRPTDDLYALMGNNQKEALNLLGRALRKMKLTASHVQKEFSFICDGLSEAPASDIFFEMQEAKDKKTNEIIKNPKEFNEEIHDISIKKISVAEYFEKTYGPLKYPDLPCAVRKRKGRDDCFFPLENLRIAPLQRNLKKLDDTQVSQMVRIAAKPPIQRFESLTKKVNELNVMENETLKSFNIRYSDNKKKIDFVETKGIIIPPPNLEYGGGRTVTPNKGSWNLRGLTALEPVSINCWAVAYIRAPRIDDNVINQNMRDFIRIATNFGIKLNNKFDVFSVSDPEDYSRKIRSKNYNFILFILPSKEFSSYKEVKWRSEADGLSLVTQCVVAQNFQKFGDPTFCSNIMIKINVKLRGKNWKWNHPMNQKDMIVFGADVTHPGQGDLTSPSIVAVASSLDSTLNTFSTKLKVQERRQEIISDLGQIVVEKLKKYYSVNRVKPQKIMFFRDGVGETQFFEVFETEITAIKNACKSLDKNYAPKITYIVAQKRHTVKFESMDTSHEPSHKITGNVIPGTVVDSIGHPSFFDFYLVSHHALQGTARPVRYHVLYDENKFKSKELYQLINDMCYLYPRATKSVSIVPAIYYAHLAAARAKCYLVGSEVESFKAPSKSLEDQLYYM